jgi:SNF2 family DNA or RNA helicase
MRERAEAKNRALTKKMNSIYLQRKKADVLGDLLPEKNEYVILCELSPLQKRIYQHIRTLPDFDLVKKAGSPCDCRVNQNFFKVYTRLPSAAERLEYYRRHKDQVVKMKDCCYDRPYNPRRHEPNQPLIDPDAVLWRFHDSHHGDEGCERCPYCMLFPALTML